MAQSSRRYPRFATEAAVELRVGDRVISGRSTNISRGGFCAVVGDMLKPGEQVVVSMALVFAEDTFSEPLELPARVVWCTPFADNEHQLGTSFLPLSEQQQKFLTLFLRYLEQGEEAREAEQVVGVVEDDDPFAS